MVEDKWRFRNIKFQFARITDNRGFEADQLDIELDDSDGQLQLPRRGAVLSVFLGWEGEALIGKGDFTVDEIEHRGAPYTLTIRARSADFRGSLNSRREVSYHDTTLGEIVVQVAKRNNLTPMLADGFAGIKIPHIDQTQETDAKFITRLAERNGAIPGDVKPVPPHPTRSNQGTLWI